MLYLCPTWDLHLTFANSNFERLACLRNYHNINIVYFGINDKPGFGKENTLLEGSNHIEGDIDFQRIAITTVEQIKNLIYPKDKKKSS